MAIVFNPFTGGFVVVPNPTFPGTLVIASGKTLTASNTLTFTGIDGTTMTFPTTSATVARTDAANTFVGTQEWSSVTTNTQSINTTSTDGLVLTNTTAAAAGAQQWSPRLRLTGKGWKTTATAASQTVDWEIETIPVQGAANPTSQLSFSAQINGAGYGQKAYFDNTGDLFFGLGNNGSTFESRLNVSSNNFIVKTTGDAFQVGAAGAGVTSDRAFYWTNSTTSANNTRDLFLYRDGLPNTLAQRNGTAAQTANFYNTFTTVATAGEWFTIDWQTTANVVNLQAIRGTSSGTARVMTLSYGGLKASPVPAITIPITSGNIVFGGGVQLSNAAVTGLVAGAVAALTTATIVLYDSTGQAYRVPCVI